MRRGKRLRVVAGIGAVAGLCAALLVLASLGRLSFRRDSTSSAGARSLPSASGNADFGWIDTDRVRGEFEAVGMTDIPENLLATLSTLEKIDDYPVYTMTYYGPYVRSSEFRETYGRPATGTFEPSGWACSLFAAVGDPQWPMFGRNFDWDHSPLLLVWLEPEEGYRSIVTVNLSYLFGGDLVDHLDEAAAEELIPLLSAPFLTFDGMNEAGLAIGMASVDFDGGYPTDPDKEDVGDLRLMRVVLEAASTVEEALTLLEGINPVSQGGPNMHYLLADTIPAAALIEYNEGQMHVFRDSKETPWQLGTNFPVVLTGGRPNGHCWRYDLIEQTLREESGDLSSLDALFLLEAVSTPMTQWSNTYDLTKRIVYIAVDKDYDTLYSVSLEDKTAVRQEVSNDAPQHGR